MRTCLDYAINNKLTPFISMQNHYSLVYREEEREMFPTLKVSFLWASLLTFTVTLKLVHSILKSDPFLGRLLPVASLHVHWSSRQNAVKLTGVSSDTRVPFRTSFNLSSSGRLMPMAKHHAVLKLWTGADITPVGFSELITITSSTGLRKLRTRKASLWRK